MSLKQFYDSISGNYEDAIERMTDEKFIQKYVIKFSGFDEFYAMKNAIQSDDWTEAFRNCHSLKGMAGNLGFVKLFKITSELCDILRPCVSPCVDIDSLVTKTEELLNEIKLNKALIEQ